MKRTKAGSPKDPQAYYVSVILPDKLRFAQHYVENISFKTDVHIIKATLKTIIRRNDDFSGSKEVDPYWSIVIHD